MARRNGFTLIETLIVLVVIGLVGLIAMPKFQQALAQSNILSAKAKLMALYAKARATAAGSSQTAILRINGNVAYVYARPRRKAGAGTIDTITPVENIYNQYGVTVSGGVDSVRVSPTGIGMDAASIILTKSGRTDTIFISQYGRVLK